MTAQYVLSMTAGLRCDQNDGRDVLTMTAMLRGE
jgi:hypothetical protein